jgi:starch phosphorylase
VVAGKAHPDDHAGKQLGQLVVNAEEQHGGRVAFLSDYAIGLASILVAGADVWINVPRPPIEASGTSRMKVALNGGLNLSVLDGWWAEAFDDGNGWAVAGRTMTASGVGEGASAATHDDLDATDVYRLLASQVLPLFYRPDADGIPHDWLIRVKHSIRTIAPGFCATRMLRDYLSRYRAGRGTARSPDLHAP